MTIEPTPKPQTCPCCGQRVQLYRRALNSGMAVALLLLCRRHARAGKVDFVDFPAVLRAATNYAWVPPTALQGGDPVKLALWGLIEGEPGERTDGSKRNGRWKATPKGIAFAKGSFDVCRYVLVYNNKVVGFETPLVDIHECLPHSFNYDEVVRWDWKEITCEQRTLAEHSEAARA